MVISKRVEEWTGEPPSWWALELYKAAFLLVGGMFIGWKWSNHVTDSSPTAVIGGVYTPEPPVWMSLLLLPGIFYTIWVVFPWPGQGSGGLSM